VKARRHSLTRYLPPPSEQSTHFRITRGKTHHGFEKLLCLLARVRADGNFELLNPAWDELGYSAQELAGHSVCELVALEPDAARAAVSSLLTEGRPVEFSLRCKDGHQARYSWNRHFDDFSTSMFIFGEELPAERGMAPL
jgi:PAS domain-containing protein